MTDRDAVRVADMLGTGSPGILWTSDRTDFTPDNYLFLDPLGGEKAYLLDWVDNGAGVVTRHIRPCSTEFYLADQADPEYAGRHRYRFRSRSSPASRSSTACRAAN